MALVLDYKFEKRVIPEDSGVMMMEELAEMFS